MTAKLYDFHLKKWVPLGGERLVGRITYNNRRLVRGLIKYDGLGRTYFMEERVDRELFESWQTACDRILDSKIDRLKLVCGVPHKLGTTPVSINLYNFFLRGYKLSIPVRALNDSDCSYADLSGINLDTTFLEGTKLEGANLTGTCLDPNGAWDPPSVGVLEEEGFRVEGDKVWGYRTFYSQHIFTSGTVAHYDIGEHKAPVFSFSKKSVCHPGIYLSGYDYLLQNYSKTYYVECYCLRQEMIEVNRRFRAKRIWVTSEPRDIITNEIIELGD